MHQKTTWNGCEIWLHRGDITLLKVDAIVNAANAFLMGGGGVDGAIHYMAGESLYAECQAVMERRGRALAPGEVESTLAGNLQAKNVFHAVGPIYDGVKQGHCARELADCYRNSLALLRRLGLESIVFPSISTGAYGYPPVEACKVVLQAVLEDLVANNACKKLIFCVYDASSLAIYEEEFSKFAIG